MKPSLSFLSGEKSTANSSPPFLLKLRSSKGFITFTICVAVFTDTWLYAVVVPVFPYSLPDRVGVAEHTIQKWVAVLLAVYGGALFVGSPLVGWYADRSSIRKGPLLGGLVFLGASTVMLCLARHIAVLVVARILQALAAAIVWVLGLAIMVDTVGQAEIGQALGYVGLSMSLGILAAPLLGGVIYEEAGYYAVFYVSFGIIALDIILRLLLIERKVALQWLDKSSTSETQPSESQTVSKEVEETEGAVQTTADISSQETPSTPPTYVPSKYPPVITLLASRRLLVALWCCVVQASLLTAFDSVMPLFVQRVFGWSSTAAGLSFLALVIPSFTAPAIGWATDNYGPRWLVFAGSMMSIPLWVLLRLVTHNSMRQKVLFFALLALLGFAITLALTPILAEITYIIESKEKKNPGVFGPMGAYAQAYGLFMTAFAAGTLIGPIWSGYVEVHAGWGTMTWTLALFSFAGAVPCLIWTGGLITETNAKTAKERDATRQTVVNSEQSEEVHSPV